jgi:tetratricopeptide (TPR) repeat protein
VKPCIPTLAAALLVASCGSTNSPAPVKPVAPQVAPPRAPVKIVISDLEPEPLPDARCDRVVALATAGDHKPAADQLDEIQNDDAFCHREALEAAAGSRRLLAEADSLIHSSTEKKRQGDVAGARTDLEHAIEVYPKYYWARKLLRDLGGEPAAPQVAEARTGNRAPQAPQPAPSASTNGGDSKTDIEADVEVIRQLIAEQNMELARIAEQEGDLEAASRWAITAMKAEPEDGELKKGIVEYARLLGLKFFSAGELSPAREIWGAAFELDASDDRLRDYLRQVDERLANLEQIRAKGGN